MLNRTKQFFAVVLTLALVLFAVPADAQAIVSAVSSVQLSYVVGEQITISGVPPSLVFTGAPNATTGALTVTTSWSLTSTRTRVDVALWFNTPTAALTDGAGHNVPASLVFANLNGGTFSPCNGTLVAPELTASVTSGGICATNVNVPITTANQAGNRTDTVVLQLQGLGPLPAATYTGQI